MVYYYFISLIGAPLRGGKWKPCGIFQAHFGALRSILEAFLRVIQRLLTTGGLHWLKLVDLGKSVFSTKFVQSEARLCCIFCIIPILSKKAVPLDMLISQDWFLES
jgi:hypothetical protein